MTRPIPLALALALLGACKGNPSDSTSQPGPSPAAASPQTPAQKVAAQLRTSLTLAEAIRVTSPLMRDATDEHDDGAALLAMWMADHRSWRDLSLLPETSHARVMKDSDAERGKRICLSGVIIQIAKEKGTPLYSGTMGSGDQDFYFYIATGSTGDLLPKQSAKFCGVVTGKLSYKNTAGGVTHSVKLVGMFDLPENKK